MLGSTCEALVSHLSSFDAVVEVGIGNRVDVARDLADRGVDVTATDVRERTVPAGVQFVVDDVTRPDEEVYGGADAVYALNLPPELHRPMTAVAHRAGAACCFTTLGAEQPTVSVRRCPIPNDTLYLVPDTTRSPPFRTDYP